MLFHKLNTLSNFLKAILFKFSSFRSQGKAHAFLLRDMKHTELQIQACGTQLFVTSTMESSPQDPLKKLLIFQHSVYLSVMPRFCGIIWPCHQKTAETLFFYFFSSSLSKIHPNELYQALWIMPFYALILSCIRSGVSSSISLQIRSKIPWFIRSSF